MSLDLSWTLLDETFTEQLLSKLNDVLANASRPEYIGPIRLSNLQLGHEAPDVGIVDVGDVWQEFLQRDEDAMTSAAAVKQNEILPSHHQPQQQQQQQNGAQKAVRRDGNLARFADRNLPFSAARSDSPLPMTMHEDDLDDDFERSSLAPPPPATPSHLQAYADRRRKPRNQRIQAFRQYSDSGQMHRIDAGSISSFDAYSSVPPSPWGAGLSYAAPSHGGGHGGYFSAWPGMKMANGPTSIRSAPHSRRTSWQRQSMANRLRQPSPGSMPGHTGFTHQPNFEARHLALGDDLPSSPQEERSSSLPSLQLQLSLHWTSQSLRVTLDTSLLINHPSPGFMSLPLTITITGLSLAAGALLAFEVDPVTQIRRSHFCLLEEEEGEEAEEVAGGGGQDGNAPGTNNSISIARQTSQRRSPFASGPGTPFTSAGAAFDGQPTSAGERILYNLTLETSVGQADKHVLKNVAKVERFVVSLVRKAIGDELVFPNFYSVELPSS